MKWLRYRCNLGGLVMLGFVLVPYAVIHLLGPWLVTVSEVLP